MRVCASVQIHVVMFVPGVVLSSGSVWKEQRKTSLEILRQLGLGKDVLATRVQQEVSAVSSVQRSRVAGVIYGYPHTECKHTGRGHLWVPTHRM